MTSSQKDSQQEYEKLIREGTWQEQAEALLFIQQNKLKSWRLWRRVSKTGEEEAFESFVDFAAHCGLTSFPTYNRIRLAKNRVRFEQIQDLNISMSLAGRLYETDLSTFKLLVLCKRLGVTEERISQVLEVPSPAQEARQLASETRRELSYYIDELTKLLSTDI